MVLYLYFHPGRVETASSRASNMLLIEEDTLGFDWGKGPKSYPEKCPVCRRFSTDALVEQPKAAGCQNRHLLDFHQSPFSQVAALIPLGARPICLGWSYQEPKFPTTWFCSNLTKSYWMRNNQNESWKWMEIFITLRKYNMRQQHEEGNPLLVVNYLVSI